MAHTELAIVGLPTTRLGTFLEERVNNFLREHGVVTGELTIRMVSNTDKMLETRSGMRNRLALMWCLGVHVYQPISLSRFENDFPTQFPYKAKAMFVFQECDGVDICIFGMHVQEYGSECPYPNSRYIYSKCCTLVLIDFVVHFNLFFFQTCVHILSGQCPLFSA